LKLFNNFEKKKRDRRHLRIGAISTALTAVVVVVFVLLNIVADTLADRYPLSVDLTAEEKYTLSEECEKVIKAMKQDVEIVLFMAQDEVAYNIYAETGLTSEADRLSRKLETALSQMASASDGKITYSYLNPNQNPAEFAKYEKYDVGAGDILFLSGERYKKSNLNNLYVLDTSNYEYSGTYTFHSTLEKELASKVYALQDERIVQVLVGHQENRDTINTLQWLYELNGYTFEEIDITASKEFNKKAELMLIAAPTSDYSDAETRRVEEWVFNNNSYGRNLMVFVDPIASCPNLYEMLDKAFGIQVTDELIWETDSNRIFDGNNFYTTSTVLNTKYTAHSADQVLGKHLFTPTARRLTSSWPAEKKQEDTLDNLGIALNSYADTTKVMKLKDAENGNENHAIEVGENDYPLTSMIAAFIDSYDNNNEKVAQATVLVSGCPSIASLEHVQNNTFSNEDLLVDVIDTLAGIEDDVTISSRLYETEALTYELSTQKLMLYIFVVGLPGAVMVVCLVIFLRRKYL